MQIKKRINEQMDAKLRLENDFRVLCSQKMITADLPSVIKQAPCKISKKRATANNFLGNRARQLEREFDLI